MSESTNQLGLRTWLGVLANRWSDAISQAARGVPVPTYLVLGGLALLQLVNPGAVQRVASQEDGRALLLVPTGSLLLSAALAAGNAIWGPRARMAPGLRDALMHCAFVVAGLKLSFGAHVVSEPAGAAIIGTLGLATAGAGVHLWVAAALRSTPPDGNWQAHRHRLLMRSDDLARGILIAILGALLFTAGVQDVPGAGLDPGGHALIFPLLALGATALLGYGFLGIWSMGHERRMIDPW